MNVRGAVTSGGNVQVGGNATIDGRNTTPTGWSSASCPPAPDQAGIRSSGDINTNGSPSIYGSPAEVQDDPSVTTSTFQTPFDALALRDHLGQRRTEPALEAFQRGRSFLGPVQRPRVEIER